MNNLDTTLRLRRTFLAPRERVFEAWTQAKLLEQWFQPMGMHIKVALLDLQIGGQYHFNLLHLDGNTSSIVGQYLEIVYPKKLVFTWLSPSTDGIETLVTLEFLEKNGTTEVLLTHERFNSEVMMINHQRGWEACIDLIQGLFK